MTTTRIPETEQPLTPRADNAAPVPMKGRVVLAELDGTRLEIVAVDGGSPPADPVARAEFAVRVLLLHRGRPSRASPRS